MFIGLALSHILEVVDANPTCFQWTAAATARTVKDKLQPNACKDQKTSIQLQAHRHMTQRLWQQHSDGNVTPALLVPTKMRNAYDATYYYNN